ncbi:MAG: DUF1492 domain-containing protein [Bacteroidetes bacterium]|nr:MAG: DUF1492 domain-containing protein [Bacteroidota bacterium]REK04777.1 MAG: DUF1492 domain-containing protein [Bacteroidota bacterium]REK36251.1 MAG: DUF1492 domain-containing protein [Bacteroidota bacterium]REK51087.1 MAG: DUF1492 domain-containing protein [Bacteroidota bacterium]
MEFESWVDEYSNLLFRYTLTRVSGRENAEDLVQETFIAAWRNRHNFREEVSIKNWLFTILKSRIIDHYRKCARKPDLKHAELKDQYFNESGHWAESAMPEPWNKSTDEALETAEFMSVLKACKDKLKETQNAVFTMKHLDGMETDEICKELEITSSNYWVLMHRAKLQLRECLEKNWFGILK